MIEASFENGTKRSTAATDAYQYDTSQRLKMHGLPSPEELACRDEFLSGDIVTMQVHFGLKGDSQTQARLARWDEDSRCWIALIPDEYLQTTESVYAYIYVSYGQDAEGNGRTKTMYELVFKPISRPAPNNVVTNEQWEAWALKKAEIELAIDELWSAQDDAAAIRQKAQEASQEAEAAAKSVQDAWEEAQEKRRVLEAIRSYWENLTVRTVSLREGAAATVTLKEGVLTYGLPMGATGEKGDTGETGQSDMELSFADSVLTITPKG